MAYDPRAGIHEVGTEDEQAKLAEDAHVDQPTSGGEVPESAADAVAWLEEDGLDDAERARRADAVEAAESARGGDPRVTVSEAVSRARG